MDIKSVSPQEACDLLTREEGYVYLDVRSTPEFSEGHPQGALNIPLHHAQPDQYHKCHKRCRYRYHNQPCSTRHTNRS